MNHSNKGSGPQAGFPGRPIIGWSFHSAPGWVVSIKNMIKKLLTVHFNSQSGGQVRVFFFCLTNSVMQNIKV